MTSSLRTSVSVAVACVAVAGAALVYRGGPAGEGPGCGGPWEAESDLARLEREARELSRVLRASSDGAEEKCRAVREVIDGRLTLPEAAARFHAADALLPPRYRLNLEAYPGGSDGERQCRRIIARVAVALEQEPARREEVVGRLEAELREHLRRHGTVRLPLGDPAPGR